MLKSLGGFRPMNDCLESIISMLLEKHKVMQLFFILKAECKLAVL